MLSLRARPKTFHNPQLMRGRQHPQQRGRKFPQHSARPYTGSYVAGRTTEQTQWFRFESCWSPPLGTASRPPNSSLPAHPTGVEPRLEPDRNFRLHAARRSHPKGLRLEGETYKLQTLHSETTGTSPHFPQTFVEAEIHALIPWSRPKFPQDLPRPNFLHLHPSDQSRGRNSSGSTPRRYFLSRLVLLRPLAVFLSGLRCSLISFVMWHAQRDFLDLCCRNRKVLQSRHPAGAGQMARHCLRTPSKARWPCRRTF